MQASLDLGQYNHMKLCQNKYDDSKVFSNHSVLDMQSSYQYNQSHNNSAENGSTVCHIHIITLLMNEW